MITPDFDNFSRQYALKKSQVLFARLAADLDTPVSLKMKLAGDQKNAFMLESVTGGEVRGRYSIIGMKPDLIWKCQGNESALDTKLADEIYAEAIRHKLSIIVEVHDNKEAENALKYEKALIGINNRNLKTLDISIDNTISIFETLKEHKGPIISESGIKNEADAKYIYEKTGIKNFLIGESLLKSDNPAELLKKFKQITQ